MGNTTVRTVAKNTQRSVVLAHSEYFQTIV